MNYNELIFWLATFKMAKKGSKEALIDIRMENERRKKEKMPSLEEDILSMLPSEEDIKTASQNASKKYDVDKLSPKQLDDMLELVESGAKIGFILLDNNETKTDWLIEMQDILAKPLMNATGFNEDEVYAIIDDIWRTEYDNDGTNKALCEWAKEKWNLDNEERITLVWSIDWNPVWITRPKEDWIDDSMYMELHKFNPSEEKLEELREFPRYQLSESVIIELLGENEPFPNDNPSWDWACYMAQEIKNSTDRGVSPITMTILDEDWGTMDCDAARDAIHKLASQIAPVWDSPSA